MTDPPVKYVILLIDGSADYPIERIGGRTPLMAANIPVMDALAQGGRTGTLATVPEGMAPGSEVANLSVLGYDPRSTYQGRGVLEAASMGIELGPDDVAMRCNLIALMDGCILDHASGHIGSEEARELIVALDQAFAGEGVRLYPGISYRHLLVLPGKTHSPAFQCWPPHDHVGRPIADCQLRATAPEAEVTAALLQRLTDRSRALLESHPVNLARREAGKRTADTIWVWSPGRRPTMATLTERFGLRGAVISAVDLIHGLGRYAGLTSIPVEGATGLYNTNYEGKARAALRALEDNDLVMIHVEGPDEAGHARDLGLKIHCLESIDKRLLALVVAGLKERGVKAVYGVLPDHLTPVERGDHVGEPVPVLIHDPDKPADATAKYDEVTARSGALGALCQDGFIRELLWRREDRVPSPPQLGRQRPSQ